MPRKAIPIDTFVWNLTDGDLLMKVWSENVHSDDRQNEEYKDQNLLERERRFNKIDIKEMTDKRSTEYIKSLIISEVTWKSFDEI